MDQRTSYRFLIEILRQDGTLVGRYPVVPDWVPAKEWIHFAGIRRGQLAPAMGTPSCSIEPIWHHKMGVPYADAFRVAAIGSSSRPSHEGPSVEVPITYFQGIVQHRLATLVAEGKLEAGEVARFLVCALPAHERDRTQSTEDAEAFAIEDVAQPLPLVEDSLEAFVERSQLRDKELSENHRTDEIPAFVPQEVLDEAAALAQQANDNDVETGGVLIGRLHRDQTVPEVFVQVTAQIPAAHTDAQRMKLSFTHDTWVAMRAAIALRGKSELLVGWWHSHPDFCKRCPPERQRTCSFSQPFFSTDDCALHREVFPRAFNLALLITERGPELIKSVFGWRRGMIVPRDYYVTRAASLALTDTRAATETGGSYHAEDVQHAGRHRPD